MRPPQMELRKHIGAEQNVWTLETMIEEAERTDKLFNHLIAFTKTLKGDIVPTHLLRE